jgi:hypothetical protein
VSGFFTIATDFFAARGLARPYNVRMTDTHETAIEDFAQGRIEVEELERRLEDVSPETNVTALVPAPQHTRVVMASAERTGPWVMPPQMTARVLWGSLVLDLRDARIAPSGATIDVSVTMGNIEVIVPPGMQVEIGASSFMGNIEDRTERYGTSGPVIRIFGSVKLGNLELMTRRRGESERDARRRRREERRAHRRWRRALPPSSLDW